jgi:hypothetical protein
MPDSENSTTKIRLIISSARGFIDRKDRPTKRAETGSMHRIGLEASARGAVLAVDRTVLMRCRGAGDAAGCPAMALLPMPKLAASA